MKIARRKKCLPHEMKIVLATVPNVSGLFHSYPNETQSPERGSSPFLLPVV